MVLGEARVVVEHSTEVFLGLGLSWLLVVFRERCEGACGGARLLKRALRGSGLSGRVGLGAVSVFLASDACDERGGGEGGEQRLGSLYHVVLIS
jgi:hypothetical protein